ncbi:spore germination protein GerPC [Amphibacillus sediminis]|uniref:spore germination protein GerPC n=1 Tax=Amphibacillus sediminis TaxID=360185 RepID=UPI00082D65DF|nr:spore germination protein GerPC [Amphibacillus sediminis]
MNMNQNYWYYINQQAIKIKELEQKLSLLEEQLSSHPRTHIDKIEYHFDQLKIERLEGTLQIGISPDDIEQMAKSYPPYHHLLTDINQLLPKEVDQLANQYQLRLTEQEKEMILHDLQRQLPERANYYYQKQLSEQAIQSNLLKDMRNSLERHFENKVDDINGSS